MEILKYASPRIKDPSLTTPSCLPVSKWSVDYVDNKGCGPNFHESRCNKFAECCLLCKFKGIRTQTCCLKAGHSFAEFTLFRKDRNGSHWYSYCLLFLENFSGELWDKQWLVIKAKFYPVRKIEIEKSRCIGLCHNTRTKFNKNKLWNGQ